MKRGKTLLLSLAVLVALAGQAQAFSETSPAQRATFGASGTVAESTSFSVAMVTQGTGVAATLGFEGVTNAFIDSGEAMEVTVDTNLAANRIIVYTDNLSGSAVPQACLNTAEGTDGGGLVGASDCSKIVPLLWAVNDTNVDHSFTTGTIGDDEVFVTDKAHVATFTTVGSTLDNQAMVRCDDGVTSVTNTSNDGLYPQFFGAPGVNNDLCNAADGTTVVAQELSKNIAVAAHSFVGGNGVVPNLSTADPADSISATSPFYLAIGADFTGAPAQTYTTSTLTVELVTQ